MLLDAIKQLLFFVFFHLCEYLVCAAHPEHVAFLQRVDVVEPDVFYAYLTSVLLKASHLLVGAPFVVKDQVPRQVLVFWRVWVRNAN